MPFTRRRWLGLAPALLAGVSHAQTRAGTLPGLPTVPIQIVVPVEPGGGIDAMARLLAQAWAVDPGLSASVLNRAGASGNLATTSVARAAPDGQTLLVTGISHLTSPLLHEQAGYDAIDDFAPVARLGTASNVLLVSDALKGMSVRDLIRDPRSQREGLAFGSAGFGHTSHLAAEFFMSRTGVRWLHVPFKGNAPALRALMAGEIQLLFLSVPTVPTALASGRVHAVAVARSERLSTLPQLPTLAEQGVAGANLLQWYGLLAPSGTPAETVRALSALVGQSMRTAAVQEQLAKHAVEPGWMGAEDFARFLVDERRRLEPLLRAQKVERASR